MQWLLEHYVYKAVGLPWSYFQILLNSVVAMQLLAMFTRVGKHGCEKDFYHNTSHLVGMLVNDVHMLLCMCQLCIKSPPQVWLSNINFV